MSPRSPFPHSARISSTHPATARLGPGFLQLVHGRFCRVRSCRVVSVASSLTVVDVSLARPICRPKNADPFSPKVPRLVGRQGRRLPAWNSQSTHPQSRRRCRRLGQLDVTTTAGGFPYRTYNTGSTYNTRIVELLNPPRITAAIGA
ncbi:MAG: hypothetical protein ACJATT_001808 [Myxococcota bacterium]